MSTEIEPTTSQEHQAKKGLLADNPWWGFFLIGFIFIGVSIWFYVDLTALEAEGGERQVHWAMLLLYQWFGKWGVVVPPLLFGLGLLGGGVFRLTRSGS